MTILALAGAAAMFVVAYRNAQMRDHFTAAIYGFIGLWFLLLIIGMHVRS